MAYPVKVNTPEKDKSAFLFNEHTDCSVHTTQYITTKANKIFAMPFHAQTFDFHGRCKSHLYLQQLGSSNTCQACAFTF